jgi:hypothetical protein
LLFSTTAWRVIPFRSVPAEENELPDYKKLPNPSHKFEVFCLTNGIEYSVNEKGSSDYYDD